MRKNYVFSRKCWNKLIELFFILFFIRVDIDFLDERNLCEAVESLEGVCSIEYFFIEYKKCYQRSSDGEVMRREE